VGHKIREYTEGKLVHALDCISELDTPKKVSDSLSPSGGTVSTILFYESVREEVKVVFSVAYSFFGKVSSIIQGVLALLTLFVYTLIGDNPSCGIPSFSGTHSSA
jgi:hypothetical protein